MKKHVCNHTIHDHQCHFGWNRDNPPVLRIAPGETVNVRLEVDTKAMGNQPVDVKVVSADLPAEVVASTQIEVVEPQLNIELVGPDERYPDSKGTYRIVLTNTGTAPARDVIVAAQVPVGGQPLAVTPRGATWSASSRTFTWKVSEVPPQERQEFTIDVQMGRVGTYTVRAGTKAERVAPIQRLLTTQIKGAPKLRVSVSESRGVLDEGETTDVDIRLRNDGSKEATNIQITGQLLGDTMQVLGVIGADGKLVPPAAGQAANLAMLPLVDRLPPGAEVTLTVRIKALKAGDGSCQVTILHDDIPKPGLSQTVITRVTPASGLRK